MKIFRFDLDLLFRKGDGLESRIMHNVLSTRYFFQYLG
jgi:hypothetical protein